MKLKFIPITEKGIAALEQMGKYNTFRLGIKYITRNAGKLEYITFIIKNKLFENKFTKTNEYVRNMIITTWQDIINNEYNVTKQDVKVVIDED